MYTVYKMLVRTIFYKKRLVLPMERSPPPPHLLEPLLRGVGAGPAAAGPIIWHQPSIIIYTAHAN